MYYRELFVNLKSEYHMHAYIFDKIDPNHIVVVHLLELGQLCRIDVRLARKDFYIKSAIFRLPIWKPTS